MGDDDDTTSAGHVSGSIAGAKLSVVDQAMIVTSGTETEIRLGNFVGVCQIEQLGEQKANSSTLVLQVKRAQVTPGTYPLKDGDIEVEYKVRDAGCSDVKTSADSGTLTLKTVSATEISGSVDVYFGTDHVTVGFAAPVCNNVPSDGTGDCVQ
jgi:hypothetical protein